MRPRPPGALGSRASIGVLLALLWVCPTASAIDERDFDATCLAEVLPHFQSGEFGSFAGVAGVRIAHARFEVVPERGALVILPGKSESFLKYAELVYDLRDSGYSIYLMDHRGVGRSGALLSGDPEKTHVESFDDYVRDLETFVDQVVDARPHTRRVMLGHSMGGTVALLYLEDHPEVFDGAILCAPMLEIITDPFPEPVARVLCEIGVVVGAGSRYGPGQGPREPGVFDGNIFTGSARRWSLWEERLIPLGGFAGTGGVTLRWLRESLAAGRRARRQAGQVRVPVMLFQAGLDGLVRPGGQEDACRRMSECELHVFPSARHEILMECDRIRSEAVGRVREFLARMAD